MLAFWNVDGHELIDPFASLDVLGVLIFADLAKKLLEVVVGHSFYFIFLDLGLVPFF